jgi:predicted kinase
MLVVLGGLPGTGKTTIARLVAATERAAYLRIDDIEHAMRTAFDLGRDVGPAGYLVGYAIAEANLRLEGTVVADSVNPIALTREGWRSVAQRADKPVFEVEIVCSDVAEHRRRVENRAADLEGFSLPRWSSVLSRQYEPWPNAGLIIDTAAITPDDGARRISAAISEMRGRC